MTAQEIDPMYVYSPETEFGATASIGVYRVSDKTERRLRLVESDLDPRDISADSREGEKPIERPELTLLIGGLSVEQEHMVSDGPDDSYKKKAEGEDETSLDIGFTAFVLGRFGIGKVKSKAVRTRGDVSVDKHNQEKIASAYKQSRSHVKKGPSRKRGLHPEHKKGKGGGGAWWHSPCDSHGIVRIHCCVNGLCARDRTI